MIDKNRVRRAAFNFLGHIDEKIRVKFANICGKTGQYDVPGELFQKRTSRKNRVLIPWKDVKNNGLTMEQLETFSGGVSMLAPLTRRLSSTSLLVNPLTKSVFIFQSILVLEVL